MTFLLDSNVLIALTVGDHVHHRAAVSWWTASGDPFATCPITEGALIRLLVRQGTSVASATAALRQLTRHARHRFWADDVSYADVDLGHVLGHGQVTDAYLAGLSRRHGGRLATFDRGLATEAADVATLIPVA